jgi:DNA-binding transcriptional LysR family regulator
MEIRALRYFIAVAEVENVSRAAEKLNVVQSALSHQIRNLELELGISLFLRNGRRIRLSPAGRSFLDEARKIIADIAAVKRRIVHIAEGSIGEIRVGFETISARNRLVSEAFLSFRASYPKVVLDLAPMTATALLDEIQSGAVDAGFLHMDSDAKELDYIEFQKIDWVLAIPRTHRLLKQKTIKLRDLQGEPFIWRPRTVAPLLYDRMMKICLKGRLVPDVVQETYNEVMMINLVSVGLGLSLMAETVVAQWTNDLVIFRKVEDFSMPLGLRFVWRRDNNSASLIHLTDIVRRLTEVRSNI